MLAHTIGILFIFYFFALFFFFEGMFGEYHATLSQHQEKTQPMSGNRKCLFYFHRSVDLIAPRELHQ